MKKQVLSLLCCCTFSFFSTAQKIENQADGKFFYARWQHNGQTLQLGKFSKKMKKQPTESPVFIQNFQKEKLENWLVGVDTAGGVLLYFHCLWGSERHFHQASMKALRQILEQAGESAPRTVIAVVWQSGGLNYEKNWWAAAEKGGGLAPFVRLISEKFAGNVQVFSHSMGNRFWEGAARQLAENQTDKPIFHWLLFSPDLPQDLSEADFVHTAGLCQKITVVGHRRDRALWFSSKIHGGRRLGRPAFPADAPANLPIRWLDISCCGFGLSNHAHFLRNFWVRGLLAGVLR